MLLLIVEVIKIAILWNAKNKLPAKTKFIKANNYNQPFNEFQVQKHGFWLNILLIFIDVIFFFSLMMFLAISGDTMHIGIPLIISLAVISVPLSMINLLPTLISHTRWKYIIFILNIFLGPTIIGWFILLIVAISTNNSAKREQEMAFLLRKISDKIGDDK